MSERDTLTLIATVATGALAFISVLLFICYLKLCSILEWISSLGTDIGSFLYDYRLIYELDKAKKLRMEALVDEDHAKWKTDHPDLV